MKILFISVYYPDFLKSFYTRCGDRIKKLDFQKHRQQLLDELFGDSDFYSDGVRENGVQAEDIISNDAFLQKKWAKENNLSIFDKTDFLYNIPYIKYLFHPEWEEKILWAQIREYSPDILYFLDVEHFSPGFVHKLKQHYFVVAQKASPIFRMPSFRETDLVLSSFPHFVRLFRKNGINSEYLKLAFGKRALKAMPKQKKIYNCTFVGGITRHHSKGNRILLNVAKNEKIDIFGYGKNYLDRNSNLFESHHGEAWGKEMYKILMQSNMTINRHINVAGKYANNMRLFEATGSGTLLLTDDKQNIGDFFKVGKEIVVYKNAEDLIGKIRYYTKNSTERTKIAKAGQARTLKDHTYGKRMKEMLDIMSRYSK